MKTWNGQEIVFNAQFISVLQVSTYQRRKIQYIWQNNKAEYYRP